MHHTTSSSAARAIIIAVALSATAACGKKDAPAVAVDTTAMMPMPEPMSTALRIDGIETGKGVNADKTLSDDAHDFGVRDTIYVSVKTNGTGTGTLAAKLTYKDGQVVEQPSQEITTTGNANHEFHFRKGTAWPKGDYKVEVMLNGVSGGSKDLTVK